MSKKMKFVIVSPKNNSGGVTVLHALCKNLTDLGYNAKMLYINRYLYKEENKKHFWKKIIEYTLVDLAGSFFPIITDLFLPRQKRFKDLTVKGCKRKIIPWVDNNTVVIYPEIVYGNFLKAKNVVRWLLYHYKYADDKMAYEKDDLFVCYREVFNDNKLNPQKRILYTPYLDLDFYKQYNYGKREGTCYIIRKGRNRPDLKEKLGKGIIIDDLTEKEKVKTFNECEYCISFDTQTAYSEIAALCGCKSIVLPENGKTKGDYRNKEDVSYGVAFSLEESEIAEAYNTRKLLKEWYIKMNKDSRRNAKQFAELCEKYFDRIK